jgi:hypothetical protein
MSNEVAIISDPSSTFDASPTKYLFAKAELKVGDKKYYEVTARQVDQAYLDEHGDKLVTKENADGQQLALTDWVITKTEDDGTSQQWALWDETNPNVADGKGASFQSRWNSVEGKPGSYSPRSVPTPMVELPEGGKVKVSWGDGWASGGPGSFLAKYGSADFNVITAADLVRLGYTGGDEISRQKLEELAAAK